MREIAPHYVVYVDGEVALKTTDLTHAERERDRPRTLGEIVRLATVYPRGTVSKLEARIRVLESQHAAWERVVRAACEAVDKRWRGESCQQVYDAVKALGSHRPGAS